MRQGERKGEKGGLVAEREARGRPPKRPLEETTRESESEGAAEFPVKPSDEERALLVEDSSQSLSR